MFAAFLDSVRYVGHLIPIAFLRIFLGYWYFLQALQKYHSDFLYRPRFASAIAESLPNLTLPLWYKSIVEMLIIQHWQSFAFVFLAIEFAIGISYLIGYVVRPIALIALLLSLNMLFLAPPEQSDFWRIIVATHFVLAWVGAGRCLGIDYYFYKRIRGLWW